MRNPLEERRKSVFSVRRDLSRQLKASDIYFVTFVIHGIVGGGQRKMASLTQEEAKRKTVKKQQQQENRDTSRAKHVDTVTKIDLNGSKTFDHACCRQTAS